MGMSVAEDESHFTLWCMMSWPLIIGHDVRNQTADTLRILTNSELLSISADPMGRAAKLVGGTRAITASTQVYLRQLIDGDFVAALYNRDDSKALAITLHWGSMWMPAVQPMAVRDLWQHREVGVHPHNFTATVSPHSIKVFRFRQLAWRPPNRTRH